MTTLPRPSRFVFTHQDRTLRSYAPSFFDPVDPGHPYINSVHAGLEQEVDDVRGKLEPADHYKLYEAAYFARTGVLEIGRQAGKGTILLALGVRDRGGRAPFWSVDYDSKLVPWAERNLKTRGLRHLVQFVHGDPAVEVPGLGPFDVVFVDRDHSYEGVAGDIAALAGRIEPGGCVMFHDYFHPANDDPQNRDYGVRQAVDERAVRAGLAFRGRFGGIALFEQLDLSGSG